MVFSNQELILAWNKVKENRGCAGVDCVTIEEFEKDIEGNINTIQEQLANGNFTPLPVLRIYIDKEDGKKRSIGIPAIRDRIVQQVLLSKMIPIFEKEFLDCSFAYRPGRSALIAIDRTESLIDEKRLDELVKSLKDFPECGDSIRVYHICEGCLKKAIILGRGEFEKEVGFHII